jgi:hypothetical protein
MSLRELSSNLFGETQHPPGAMDIEKYKTTLRSSVKKGGHMHDISEEQIRIRAYQLWELVDRL